MTDPEPETKSEPEPQPEPEPEPQPVNPKWTPERIKMFSGSERKGKSR